MPNKQSKPYSFNSTTILRAILSNLFLKQNSKCSLHHWTITPLTSRAAQSPVPINLKDDIRVELAVLHKYGIIITLPLSKYASSTFALREPNGNLGALLDIQKNTHMADDYTNNNHPVSN